MRAPRAPSAAAGLSRCLRAACAWHSVRACALHGTLADVPAIFISCGLLTLKSGSITDLSVGRVQVDSVFYIHICITAVARLVRQASVPPQGPGRTSCASIARHRHRPPRPRSTAPRPRLTLGRARVFARARLLCACVCACMCVCACVCVCACCVRACVAVAISGFSE